MSDFKVMDEPCVFQDCRQMVFCILYCGGMQPYLNYAEYKDDPEKRDRVMPVVLQLMRWDGFIGNPGGFVDEGETDLVTAVLRELQEEANFAPDSERVKPLLSHTNDDNSFAIHCFECEINEEELMRILNEQQKAEHYLSESTMFAVLINDFGWGNGYSTYKKHQFKATAGVELDVLIEQKGWLASTT